MFDFMFEPPEITSVAESSSEVTPCSAPQPTCIHRCNSSQDQISSGTLMSPRRQTYICVRCMADFDRMIALDKKQRGRV